MTHRVQPTALVLGVNGQDGSFAAENLLSRGYSVVGVGRQAASRWVESHPAFRYVKTDLARAETAARLVSDIRPDLVMHLAAAHGPAGFDERMLSNEIFSVNLQSVVCALEALASVNARGIFIYASSSHVFGSPPPPIVNIETERRPYGLYGISKSAATDVVTRYRERYGLAASAIHFFNHESDRKGADYFVPRLVDGLLASLADGEHVMTVSALDFHCDWGCAREYMDIAVDLALNAEPANHVVATGRSMLGRELAERLYASRGLDYRRHVKVEGDGRGGEVSPYMVNLEALSSSIGRAPRRSILDVCQEMLAAKIAKDASS